MDGLGTRLERRSHLNLNGRLVMWSLTGTLEDTLSRDIMDLWFGTSDCGSPRPNFRIEDIEKEEDATIATGSSGSCLWLENVLMATTSSLSSDTAGIFR